MTPRILLLGGHGKVSLLLTPKLISRSWNLTSVIRDPAQKPDILSAGKNGPGKVDILIASLSDVKSQGDAQKILDQAKPDWVIWSAGAGGKGGVENTNAIDRDACIYFIRASISTPSVSKFLLVSAMLSRRNRPSWWDDATWAQVQKVATEVMPDYTKAKLAADEALTVLGEERRKKDSAFSYVVLRPGNLSDDKETGKIYLGKTPGRGQVTRADVADVTARLLEKDEANGWFDLIGGDRDSEQEVQRAVSEGDNAIDGEDLGVMKANI